MEFDARYVDMILLDSEDEHLEFKEAKRNFHFEELVKYCAALANEQGGTIVFGVTDRLPRKVVGTAVFSDLERTKFGLLERLKLRIEATAVIHPQGRVILFRVPSRPIGMPIQYGGAYWMRAGESLTAMTPDMLKRILLGLTQLSTNKVRFGCESAFNCVSPNSFVGKRGVYTRRRGLDHATNKALLRNTTARVHDTRRVARGGACDGRGKPRGSGAASGAARPVPRPDRPCAGAGRR